MFRSRQYTFTILLIALFSSTYSIAQQETAEHYIVHEADYLAKFGSFSVDMKRQLINLGNGRFRLYAKAKNFWGTVTEQEEFSWDSKGQIVPISYHYNQRTIGLKRERSAVFDWTNQIAKIHYKKKAYTLKLSEGMLGPMSYQLKLQLDLINQHRALTYRFVHKNRIKHATFEIEEKQIKSKDHPSESLIKIRRVNEAENKLTLMWFDRKDHYVLNYFSQKTESKNYSLSLQQQQFNSRLAGTPYQVLKQR